MRPAFTAQHKLVWRKKQRPVACGCKKKRRGWTGLAPERIWEQATAHALPRTNHSPKYDF